MAADVQAQRRCFEDLAIGQVAESGDYAVTAAEMLEFARRYDPQPFHTDREAARSSMFGEVVASGIHTAALWRMLDHRICGDIAWLCGVAWEEVRWPHPVRAGDRLRARAEVIGLRPSRSSPERGVVEMRYSLINHRQEICFTCRSVNLIARRRN